MKKFRVLNSPKADSIRLSTVLTPSAGNQRSPSGNGMTSLISVLLISHQNSSLENKITFPHY
jgi:hypothetical protein